MQIREASVKDFEEIFSVWKRAKLTIAKEQREHAAFEALLEKNPGLCLVAEDEGKIVGTILGSFNGRTAWINHVAVLPGYQQKGLGTKLMAEVEKRFKTQNVKTIRLGVYDVNVIPFYEKLGYAIIKDITFLTKKLE